jgi:hypothetical protein
MNVRWMNALVNASAREAEIAREVENLVPTQQA